MWSRIATPNRILVVGWVVFFCYANPGFMSYDSVYQLAQARNLEPMNDWHPPVMGVIWSVLDFFVAGPLLMLVLQSVLFLVGTYVLLRRMTTERAAAIAAVVLLLVPQNLIVMAVIWKDSQMAGMIIAAIAALTSENRRWRIVGYGLLFFATTMRYNSAAATLPIIVLFFAARGTKHWFKRYALGFAAWLALTVAAFGFSKLWVEKKAYVFNVGMAPVDLVGTLRHAGRLTDEEIFAMTPGVPWAVKEKVKITIGTKYRPLNTFLEVAQEGDFQLFDYPVKQEQLDAFASAWKTVVTKYPLAFLRHRAKVFKAQLTNRAGVWFGFSNADWGRDWINHDCKHSKLQWELGHALVKLAASWYFEVVAYLLLAIALLPLTKGNRIAFAIVSSGVLYELGLFAVAPAVDYRYSHWMVCCTLLGAVVLILQRARIGGAKR